MDTPTQKWINDQITKWHTGVDTGQPLHEFLGWTWDEYKLWVEKLIWPERVYVKPDPAVIWSDEAVEAIGTIRWFGPMGDAPVTTPDGSEVDPPVDMHCSQCDKKIAVTDAGVVLPMYSGNPIPTMFPYHRWCFLASLGLLTPIEKPPEKGDPDAG